MPLSRAADTSSSASGSWGWWMATSWACLARPTSMHGFAAPVTRRWPTSWTWGGPDNVINLFQPQLALDEAWPGFTFEKIDAERASLILGMFTNGSLVDETNAVIKRIGDADLLRKLVDYVVDRAGLEYSIARAKLIAMWMADQAKPSLAGLKEAAEHQKIVLAAQKEFAGLVEGQVEVVGPHLQQLNTIYHKHHH